MAVVNTKSVSVTNADAAPQVLNDLQIAGGKVKCLRATVEQGASDNDGSVYRLARVHSSWLMKGVRKFHDAITGGTSYDLGLYRVAADGGAVVDADAYASTVSLASADTVGIQIGFEARDSGDRLVALTIDRELGRIGHGALGFGVEGQYAFHWGQENYNEWSLAAVARWHDFLWNKWIVTTFAFATGPSYTNIIPPIEANKGITTQWLNQADLEFTFALPSQPWNQVFFRMEHRSGIFGLIDGAGDGSNFLTLGYRYHF
ncbi:MAG: hypothetical protein NTY59_08130 [Alphaproteobacteria bacterium]|nr:hypothetical protein [Alphaproteobacteria bacterium]